MIKINCGWQEAAARLAPVVEARTLLDHSTRGVLSTLSLVHPLHSPALLFAIPSHHHLHFPFPPNPQSQLHFSLILHRTTKVTPQHQWSILHPIKMAPLS